MMVLGKLKILVENCRILTARAQEPAAAVREQTLVVSVDFACQVAGH